MAYTAPYQPGDRHPKIPGAKRFLSRYSYGKGLGESDEYTVEFGIALRTWAPRFNAEIDNGRAGPRVPEDGSFNWAVQRQMGLDDAGAPAALKPLVLTGMGHLGNMTAGPDYLAARPLEVRQQVQIQMVGGFNNNSIPFDLAGQKREIHRLLHEPQLRLLERPSWGVSMHSRAAMAWCHYWMERDPGDPIWRTFRGGLLIGNPNRPTGTVAPWIQDKPDPDTQGLSPYCLPEPIPGVAEVSRKNDLYADKKIGVKASELKVAIIKLVAYGELFGRDSITEELLGLVLQFGQVVWALFAAITSGIQFLINMDPHHIFDLGPAERHLAAVLGV
ncbi:Uncharacterised protein [Mycolicibacterium vanbaalenii]|uniref:Uncharacterized protein n=1 Tax=Mycolicibacterium vanbaalenii TaxID=110539 RepID=A0A5S9MN13_MYCVN|nr:hypothetical protein [Mycolicibacterium vanbaalenii]CAA0078367.1 Uncharacterised protein [Mycolicibacterium vanbaalenii]